MMLMSPFLAFEQSEIWGSNSIEYAISTFSTHVNDSSEVENQSSLNCKAERYTSAALAVIELGHPLT